MTLKLYKCGSDTIVMNKTTGSVVSTKNVTLYGDNVKETPSCVVPYSDDVLKCNYAYISELGRYYNIDKHNMLSGGRIELVMSCDLLKSGYNDIMSSVGTFTRCNRSNKAISDNLVMRTSTVKTSYRRLGNAVPTTSTGTYLMSVAQGTVTVTGDLNE